MYNVAISSNTDIAASRPDARNAKRRCAAACEQVDEPVAEEEPKPVDSKKHKKAAQHEEVAATDDDAADDSEDATLAAPAKPAKKGYKYIAAPSKPANDYQKSWAHDDEDDGEDGEYPPYSKMTSPPGVLKNKNLCALSRIHSMNCMCPII